MNKNLLMRISLGVIILIVVSISVLVGLYTNYLWFDALGFSEIFLISLFSQIKLFAVAAVIFFLFAIINLWISTRFIDVKKRIVPFKFKVLIAAVISVIVGAISSSAWFKVLQYIQQIPFNIQDPILMKDVSFYIFSLPFLSFVWTFLMGCLFITTILVLLDYLQSLDVKRGARPINPDPTVPPSMPAGPEFNFKDLISKTKPIGHLGILCSLIFGLLAVKHFLSRFSIMYSEQGIVVGAGYSDVVAFLPMVKIMMVLAVVIAVVFLIWAFYITKQPRL